MSENRTTRHRWVAYAALTAGAILLAKASLIILSGNTVSESAMAVLYLLGLLVGIVAAVGVGLRQPTLLRRIARAGRRPGRAPTSRPSDAISVGAPTPRAARTRASRPAHGP